MGRLKLSYQDLSFLTFDDLLKIQEGHDIDKRDEWERSRMIGMISLMPHLKKGANLEPSKVWPLPWESTKPNINLDQLREDTKKAKLVFEKLKLHDRVNRKDRGADRRLNKGPQR
jgi:hypothetical protein